MDERTLEVILQLPERICYEILRKEGERPLLVFRWMGRQRARVPTARRDPLLLWLASRSIEASLASKRRRGVLVVG